MTPLHFTLWALVVAWLVYIELRERRRAADVEWLHEALHEIAEHPALSVPPVVLPGYTRRVLADGSLLVGRPAGHAPPLPLTAWSCTKCFVVHNAKPKRCECCGSEQGAS